MKKKIEMIVWIPDPIFMEHIEHFCVAENVWKKCKSSRDSPCPFTRAPHKLASTGGFCDCGNTMEEFIKRTEGMIIEI